MTSRFGMTLSVLLLLMHGNFNVLIGQRVLSPSVDKQTNQRIQDALPDNNSVEAELNAAASNRVEPQVALLNAVNTMIPGDITSGELTKPLEEMIGDFLLGNIQDSLTKLQDMKKKHPQLPPPEILIAGMLFAAGNQQAGRLWMEKTAVDYPEYPSTYSGFARVAISEKRVTDAEALLEKAQRVIEAGSWSDEQQKLFRTELLDGLTDVAISRKKLEKAREYLLQLETMLPENSRVQLRLAQVEFDLENVDKSLEYLNQTRVLMPNLRVPEVIISDWLLRKQKTEESEKWITQAATAHPQDANVQLDFAKWLLRNERLPQSLETVKKAEQFGADPYVVRFLKGQIFFARRSYEVAEMHFQNLNQIRPGDGDAANMLCLCLIESKNTIKQSKALELATMNQRLFPRSPTAMATLGWIYYRLGRKAEAENAFKQLTSAKNLEPASAYFLANYLNDNGNPQGAMNLLTAALGKQNYFMFRNSAKELLEKIQKTIDQEANEAGDARQSKDKKNHKDSSATKGDG